VPASVPRTEWSIRPIGNLVLGRVPPAHATPGQWYLWSMSRRRAATGALVALGACALLAGCGGTQDAAVAEASTSFLEAVDQGDGEAGCALLAPAVRTEIEDTSGKSCDHAILDEPLGGASGRTEVEVFDTAAQAVVGSETLFLSRFDGRWLVIAAACTAVPDEPYDCSIGMP
jgi:hypothetical protein